MSFSERLQEVMNEKGYTKYRVAKALNMSATTISNYLNNKTKPDTTKLEVLSHLLGVNRNWLVSGEGEKYRKVVAVDDDSLGVDSVGEDDSIMTRHLVAIVDKQASSLKAKDEQMTMLLATNELLLRKLASLLEKLLEKF
ncbi:MULTISPECIES: helix-turn-helix domain-containing protein [Butyricimonas]|uniref:helix-turn-helix domain-containing protein n=1 Tax=Butyricimonas TaxID=574697 RepID=UPI000C07BAD4|nr:MULTISPECIES: helix-turn-helix domain-containing protein [Butyricimonas]MCB6973382.1 helix-turn-helix domain-containing protein [Butyricimonas synergistica]MCG4520147.1 helix-turn-helix domain-containing protein [Butyricimonas sp. DFI.6.44]